MSIKVYIVGNTGTGKTALMVFFAKYYRGLFPDNIIYSNINLNISNFVYTEFGFLPCSEFLKGNKMICFDDVITIDNLKTFQSFLAVISRKTNTSIILTCQYYTDIERKLRMLCHAEIEPKLTKLIYDKNTQSTKLSNESVLIYEVYNPETLDYICSYSISNILSVIKNAYNTNEIPKIPNERTIKQEIAKYSNTLDDLEFNVSVYTKNKAIQKRLIREIGIEKGFIME